MRIHFSRALRPGHDGAVVVAAVVAARLEIFGFAQAECVVGRGAEKVAPEQICQPLLEVGHGAVLGAEMVGHAENGERGISFLGS